jgi:outer membrane lipopolysaccharide assembly protein LptE/RlpB
MSRIFPAAVLLATLSSIGCGYHTAGHAVLLPQNIKTIAVPGFTNRTETYKIDQILTASVVRELTTRTHYRIVNERSDTADATLKGTVLSSYTAPLTYDSSTGRAASIQVVITMRVSLTDNKGKSLYDNSEFSFRDQYQVSSQVSSFFEEDSPALQRISQQFARSLVSNLLEGF